MLGAWPEPFGLVAIESMATGTPVIARRAGALTETIDHGETGFLVDDEIEAELAIRFARDLDRAQRSDGGSSIASRQARMADEYEAVYRELVAGSSRGARAGDRRRLTSAPGPCWPCATIPPRAPVAQWTERSRPKAGVGGSSPSGGATNLVPRGPPRRPGYRVRCERPRLVRGSGGRTVRGSQPRSRSSRT